MDISEVCRKIFEIVLPLADKAAAPVASINIGITDSCPFTEQELWNAFDSVRWDTALASAELQIFQKDGDYCLKVLGLELFEEEDITDNCVSVPDGVVF